MSLFNNVARGLSRQMGISEEEFLERFAVKQQPQKQKTSRELNHWEDFPARLLRDIESLNGTGRMKKFKAGDTVYVKVDMYGTVNIYPFAMAGEGYEMVEDGAEEGVDYEFI